MKTIAQRRDAFIVQLDGDATLGLARVYDAVLGRLYPSLPLDEITNAGIRAIGVVPDALLVIGAGDWSEPVRQISTEEIAVAERVEEVTSLLDGSPR